MLFITGRHIIHVCMHRVMTYKTVKKTITDTLADERGGYTLSPPVVDQYSYKNEQQQVAEVEGNNSSYW